MNSSQMLRVLVCGALMLGAPALARAESTFDMPAGARFNEAKLAKITEFFTNEVTTGKIAGANVLIQQHGKPVYHQIFGVQDVVSKTPISDKTIFRLSSLTKVITSVVAMELMATGVWFGVGVLGPEALSPKPFLDLVTAYGSPWGMREGG